MAPRALQWMTVSMLALSLGGAACSNAQPPVRVGVLLPLTGESALHYDESLNWALDQINSAGGVRGRPIELVYQDTGTIPQGASDAPVLVWQMAITFLSDPTIDIVIGTDDDDTTFAIAPAFINTQKILISPGASTADLSRAFAGNKFLRRTVVNAAAEAQVLTVHAQRTGAQTISVLATAARAGSTFFDWIPYHAAELGLTVDDALRIAEGESDCTSAMVQVLSHGAPDVLYLIPENGAQAACMIEQASELSPTSRVFLSDPARFPGLFDTVGDAAEGIEGISTEPPLTPAAGPNFKTAYNAQFGHDPAPFAANAFDALALAAYALNRADGAKGAALASALDDVVQARGELTAWNQPGMTRAFQLIESGSALPDITGAASGLSYSERLPLELTSGTFAVWQVQSGVQEWNVIDAGGTIVTFPDNYVSLDGGTSPLETLPILALMSPVVDEDAGYIPAARTGGWAFIAAMSSTMDNYRHQADALNTYQMLKARGFTDDRIILVLADDLADAGTNPDPGTVFNVPGGANLRTSDVVVDYHPADLSPSAILDILQGTQTSVTPNVINSTASDDVFVFWVGHGGDMGVLVGDSDAEGEASTGQFITPFALAAAIQAKFAAQGFRQLVMVLDTCHSGTMGQGTFPPGVVLMTGATAYEDSYAANFDSSTSIWDADGFSWAVNSLVASTPTLSIADLYAHAYVTASGSHPQMFNAPQFGQVSQVTIGSILSP